MSRQCKQTRKVNLYKKHEIFFDGQLQDGYRDHELVYSQLASTFRVAQAIPQGLDKRCEQNEKHQKHAAQKSLMRFGCAQLLDHQNYQKVCNHQPRLQYLSLHNSGSELQLRSIPQKKKKIHLSVFLVCSF